MIRGFRYRIYPNKEQEQQLNQMLGNARFVYNWALDRRIKEYQSEKKSISGRDMSKAIKYSANKRRGKQAHNIKSVYSVNSKNQINNYESITDASKKTNISISSISNNLSNKSKTAGGLIWHYQQKI